MKRPTRLFFRDLGLFLYRAELKAGEENTLISPNTEFGDNPNITILPTGKVLAINPARDPSELEWSASPDKMGLGLSFPGTYTMRALENSVYVCLGPLPREIGGMDKSLYTLEHVYLITGQSVTISGEDNYVAFVLMDGNAVMDGVGLSIGKVYVGATESKVVSATGQVHLTLVKRNPVEEETPSKPGNGKGKNK